MGHRDLNSHFPFALNFVERNLDGLSHAHGDSYGQNIHFQWFHHS